MDSHEVGIGPSEVGAKRHVTPIVLNKKGRISTAIAYASVVYPYQCRVSYSMINAMEASAMVSAMLGPCSVDACRWLKTP